MKARNFLKYFLLLIIAINLTVVAYVFFGAASAKKIPPPNPNGYDDFVRAGQLIKGDVLNTNANREELALLVSTNADALQTLHLGLSHESRVPDDYSPAYVARVMQQMVNFKTCASLLVAEAKLAEMEKRTNDAVKIYLDGVHFGQECSHGGVLIVRLIGNACEMTALKPFGALITKLDSNQCKHIALALEEIDAKAESAVETLEHEKVYIDKTANLGGKITLLINGKITRAALQKGAKNINAGILLRRKIMVDSAARAYELEKGKRPSTLSELVPAYLKAIPQDPETFKPLALNP